MRECELLALVKFNDGKALVLKEKPNFKYTMHGGLIIGIDDSGTFVDCLYYETPVGRFKAFAGREFDITLENGEVVHCNGQWWHGGTGKAEKILGKEIVSATVRDIESLKKCYVYAGCFAFKDELEKLVGGYDGKVYGYDEYREILRLEK